MERDKARDKYTPLRRKTRVREKERETKLEIKRM